MRVSKTALWPIELINVEDRQKYSRKLDGNQTTESLKLTTTKPQQRMPILQEGIQSITGPTNLGSLANGWGLKISTELMRVPARILDAPEINYGGNKKEKPNNGQWKLANHKFTQPKQISSLYVFVFAQPNWFNLGAAQASVTAMIRALRETGCQVATDKPHIFYGDRNASNDMTNLIKTKIKGTGATGPPQMILCYLTHKPSPDYAVIKRFGDVETGVVTQVLQVSKVTNPKVGGRECKLGRELASSGEGNADMDWYVCRLRQPGAQDQRKAGRQELSPLTRTAGTRPARRQGQDYG